MNNISQVTSIIDEDNCIGCTKCVSVCPNNAIIGMKNFIHVIIEQWCFSCNACIPVCPTDCISKKNKTISSSPSAENFAIKNIYKSEKQEEIKYFDIDKIDGVTMSEELEIFLHEKD